MFHSSATAAVLEPLIAGLRESGVPIAQEICKETLRSGKLSDEMRVVEQATRLYSPRSRPGLNDTIKKSDINDLKPPAEDDLSFKPDGFHVRAGSLKKLVWHLMYVMVASDQYRGGAEPGEKREGESKGTESKGMIDEEYADAFFTSMVKLMTFSEFAKKVMEVAETVYSELQDHSLIVCFPSFLSLDFFAHPFPSCDGKQINIAVSVWPPRHALLLP